ncbi:hypothetical protein [Natrononativus amylolyticus]|uniref:hypothetical protein n=1 Tax=Natrononativus amylolyticus TaxID=2963434 RepID=UPI0020CE89B0|nr:hypothetical protein [Natrononativus amylolyticus]
MGSDCRRKALASAGLAGAFLAVSGEPVAASNVAAGLGQERELAVPTWLVLVTGGAAVGASGLLAALVTDRTFVSSLHDWTKPLRSPPSAAPVGGALGVVALLAVVIVGLEGPAMPTANLAVLLAFVGLRAVLPMVAFLVVDPWPAIDPFRTVAEGVRRVGSRIGLGGNERGTGLEDGHGVAERGVDERGIVTYPERLRSWPALAGLAVLVWLELALPVTADPRVLALLAAGYTGYAVCGAVTFSPAVWFRRADPFTVLFRLYGAIAPIQRVGPDRRLVLVVPGSGLRRDGVTVDSSEVAIVLFLVWELTFNGFVVTPPGAATVRSLVSAGLSPAAAYLVVLLVGYAVFATAFHAATVLARRTAPTYLPTATLTRRFAPPLLAIAAGYHLAHYAAFALSLSPATASALTNPLSPPVNPTVFAIPGWIGGFEVAALLVGHLLAVWAAHAVSFDLFPGRLQAIRSQYPFIAVMIGYTALSLWLLSLPATAPPFVE